MPEVRLGKVSFKQDLFETSFKIAVRTALETGLFLFGTSIGFTNLQKK